MAITAGAVTSKTDDVGGTSFTWASENSGASNRLLIVMAHALRTGSNTFLAPTGITYNGDALTSIAAANSGSGGVSLWYLINPASGNNNTVVTYGQTATVFRGSAQFFYGVRQTEPIGQFDTITGAASSYGIELTDLWIDSWAFRASGVYHDSATITTSVDGSSAWNYTYVAVSTFRESLAGSYSDPNDVSSATFTHTFNRTSTGGGMVAFEIRAAGGTIPMAIEESVTMAETLDLVTKKNIEEAIDITETRQSGALFNRTFTEQIDITETMTKVKSYGRNIEESIEVTETVRRVFGKGIEEVINISQSLFAGIVRLLHIVEEISIGEWLRNVLGGIRVGFWTKQAKEDTTWTPETKKSATWTLQSKQSTTWTKQDKEL